MGPCLPKGSLSSPSAPAAAAAQLGTGRCYLNIGAGCSDQPRNMGTSKLIVCFEGWCQQSQSIREYVELGEASRGAVSQGASQKGDEKIFGSCTSVGFLCCLSFIAHVVDGVFFFFFSPFFFNRPFSSS